MVKYNCTHIQINRHTFITDFVFLLSRLSFKEMKVTDFTVHTSLSEEIYAPDLSRNYLL